MNLENNPNNWLHKIVVVNTVTKIEKDVCVVYSPGDVPNIINGLQLSAKTSPLKYEYRKNKDVTYTTREGKKIY